MYIIRLDTYESNNYSLIGSADYTAELEQNNTNHQKNWKHSTAKNATRIGHKIAFGRCFWLSPNIHYNIDRYGCINVVCSIFPFNLELLFCVINCLRHLIAFSTVSAYFVFFAFRVYFVFFCLLLAAAASCL